MESVKVLTDLMTSFANKNFWFIWFSLFDWSGSNDFFWLILYTMNFVKSEYKYSDITAKILASSFEVYNAVGCGFIESVYHRSLIKFKNRELQFYSEYELPIFYKNEKVGARRADFLVEKVVTVVIKAVSKLEDIHLVQAINYLEAFNIEIGMLINFGAKSLEYKRLANPKLFKSKSYQIS